MTDSTTAYPVPPDCVYVWRGYASTAMTYDAFVSFLGTVFVPACVLLQPPLGLRAYVPSMVPQSGKPHAVPDQTALMFWKDDSAHDDARKALAERIYTNLHGDVYDMTRSALPEVPVAIPSVSEPLKAEQPYHVFDTPADWMTGTVRHLVAARRDNVPVGEFLLSAASWAHDLVAAPPAEVDGALICCGEDYAVAWVHASAIGAQLEPVLAGLEALTTTTLSADAVPTDLGAELWDDWPGLDLTKHGCVNFQLRRPTPQEATPRKVPLA